MNDYELAVLTQWVKQDEQMPPIAFRVAKGLSGNVGRLMGLLQWSAGSRQSRLVKRMKSITREAIIRTLEQAATASQFEKVEGVLKRMGSSAETASDIRMLPLQTKDEVCRTLARSQKVTVTAEGAIAGFATSLCEVIPGLQGLVLPCVIADLSATIYLMAQHAIQTGYSYGFNLYNPEDIPHFLFAMAPSTDDAGLVEAKLSAHLAMRESGLVLAKTMGEHLSVRMLSNTPAMTKLIDLIAYRIVTVLAEKETSILIPFAGAVIQGAINAAFAEVSYVRSVRYFQRLHMIDRYGEEYLNTALTSVKEGRRATA